MEYTNLFLAAAGFTLIHFASATNIRANVISRFGTGAYMGPFALMSLSFFGWMCYEFYVVDISQNLWNMPDWYLWVHAFIMLIAMFFILLGGQKTNAINGGLKAITRHPSNWGTTLFAGSHILVNGSIESLIFFGSLFSVGLIGTLLLDKRKTREADSKWLAVVKSTSWLPFIAMAQGRAKFSFNDFKWWQILLVVVVWAVIIEIHRGFFGKYILPL